MKAEINLTLERAVVLELSHGEPGRFAKRINPAFEVNPENPWIVVAAFRGETIEAINGIPCVLQQAPVRTFIMQASDELMASVIDEAEKEKVLFALSHGTFKPEGDLQAALADLVYKRIREGIVEE